MPDKPTADDFAEWSTAYVDQVRAALLVYVDAVLTKGVKAGVITQRQADALNAIADKGE